MKTTRALQCAVRALEAAKSKECSQQPIWPSDWRDCLNAQRCRSSGRASLPTPSCYGSPVERPVLLNRRHCTIEYTTRTFSTSRCLQKKGGKAAREEKRAAEGGKGAPADDPYDFAALEGDIAQAIERLKNDLSKLRAGGRFNPEVVENLRVQPEKSSTQTTRLSDLAQVIPKGRQVQIIVGEKDHLKPISSAIQSSTLSLTPQPDPTGSNPLLLLLNIPPPTAESRKAAGNEASKAGDKAGTAVRDARGKQQKKLRALELAKSARPDDLKKARGLMEKVVERGQGEVKKVVEEKRRGLEMG